MELKLEASPIYHATLEKLLILVHLTLGRAKSSVVRTEKVSATKDHRLTMPEVCVLCFLCIFLFTTFVW